MEYKEKINEKYVNKFLDYLKLEKNYSDKTIDSYRFDLLEFDNFISKNFLLLNEDDILNYLNNIRKKKKTSVSRYISSLKSFYKYLNTKKIISENPMIYISYPKKDKKLPNYIKYNELYELIRLSLNGKNKYRDNLIVELLYATGVRVSELVNIKMSDINTNRNEIIILGKGNKERIVYFGQYAKEALENYISSERKEILKGKESKYLFVNQKGENLSTRTIENCINRIIKGVSIKNKISPHTLRHTFATDMLNSGCDIRVVGELLGHASLSSTQVYTHITNEELRNTYLKCIPRK